MLQFLKQLRRLEFDFLILKSRTKVNLDVKQ